MRKLPPYTTIDQLLESGLISVRLYHCLRAAHIDTLWEITERVREHGNFDSMLAVAGFGRKMLSEIESFAKNYCQTEPDKEPDDQPERAGAPGKSLAERYGDYLLSLDAEAQKTLREVCPDADALVAMLGRREPPVDDEMSPGGHERLWGAIYDAAATLSRGAYPSAQTQALASGLHTYSPTAREKAVFMLALERHRARHPRFDQFMEQTYQRLLSNHGTRAQNRLREAFPSYLDALEQSFRGRVNVSDLRNAGVGSINEINQAICEVRDECARVLQLDERELGERLLQQTYDYFTPAQMRRFADYRREHGHYPMMWALYEMLMSRDDSRALRFRALHGVGQERVSPGDYAKTHSLTYERARQLRNFGVRDIQHPVISSEDWHDYPGISLPFYTPRSGIYVSVVRDEGIDGLSFDGFGALLSLIEPLDRFEVRGYPYYISHALFAALRVRPLVLDISRVGCRQESERLLVPLSQMVRPLLSQDALEPQAMDLAAAIADESFGIKRQGDDLVSPRRVVNVRREICDILAQKGRPMRVSEIVEEFLRRHPGHSTNNCSRMRAYLQMTPQAVAMGKSSTYALADWAGRYYTGTMRDCVVQVLEACNRTMTVRELVEQVRLHFPNVSVNSLAASISSCRRLQRFGHSVGLRGRDYPPEVTGAETLEKIMQYRQYLDQNGSVPFSNHPLTRWYHRALAQIDEMEPECRRQMEQLVQLRPRYLKRRRAGNS